MFTCFPCLGMSTRGAITDITSHMKDMSLKAIRVHHRMKGKKKAARCGRDEEEEKTEEEEEEEGGGGEGKEWVAEADPGVLITFAPLPDGGNSIRKIRFSKGTFDDWEAQKWWSENYEKIVELYSVSRLHSSPSSSESREESSTSSAHESPTQACESDTPPQASRPDDSSNSSAEEGPTPETVQSRIVEVMVEDEPGVFVTIGFLPNGTKELIRAEFSRERFGEVKARVWWEENKARLQEQYFSVHHCNTLAEEDQTPNTQSGLQSRVVQVTVEDEPGAFITIRSLSNRTKKILRVELSRERFGEVKARVWWEENKDRLQKQYSQALPCSCSEVLF